MPQDSESQEVQTLQDLPKPGTPEYEAWLDGPRPEHGRGQWLAGHSARSRAAKAAASSSGTSADGAAQTRTVTLDAERTADLQRLQGLIDGSKTLPSDVIRAMDSKQRLLSAAALEQVTDEHGALVALRDALLPIPAGERADALGALVRVQGAEGAGSAGPAESAT